MRSAVLALLLGLNNCFENPTRQSFVLEMVGPDELRNAVSLNSTLVNAARAVGPRGGGDPDRDRRRGLVLPPERASFIAVVGSLMTMDRSLLTPSRPAARARGQLREGFRYVARTPELAIPLVMMGLIGMLAYNFQVTLPVVAKQVFGGDARTFGLMSAAMGIGAVGGGLVSAARGKTGTRPMVITAFAFGTVILIAAVAPTLPIEFAALGMVGFASVSFLAMANSTLQLGAAPQMRGRVMALWSVAFLGSTPIGGPVIGWITTMAGARVGLAVGGVSCLVAAVLGLVALRHVRNRRATIIAFPREDRLAA